MIGDKEESAVKKEVSEKVEVTEDVTDKKLSARGKMSTKFLWRVSPSYVIYVRIN